MPQSTTLSDNNFTLKASERMYALRKKKTHIISFPNPNRQDVSVLLAMDCMLVTLNILSIYEVSIISALKKLSSMEIKYMVSESEPRCSSYSIYSSSSNCVL